MNLASLLTKHLRELYTGGSWTAADVQEVLSDITYAEAIEKVDSFNTIALLTFHIDYYAAAAIQVLQGGELVANDKYSFDLPPLKSEKEWLSLKTKTVQNGLLLSSLVEKLADDIFEKPFVNEKYGTYYRNIQGTVEHTHYHLGQIVILKKLLRRV